MSFQVARNPRPTFVTALPTGSDGQEVYYQSTAAGTGGGASDSMSTVGAVWHLRFRSTASGGNATYPWEFVGGAALYAVVLTDQALSAGTGWQNLATAGPIITAPLKGTYRWQAQSQSYDTTTAQSTIGVSVNDAAPATLADEASTSGQTIGKAQEVPLVGEGLVSTAGHTVKLKYIRTSGTTNFRRRRLQIIPIRVG